MKKPILLLILFLGITVMFTSCKDSKSETKTNQSELGVEKADLALNDAYQCPMDCEKGKTYDKEGTCPVCKMNLIKVEKEHDHDEHTENE